MTADELRETVVKPAQEAGLLVERELTARIVEEVLDEPGGLPMLSHALLDTWRRRKGRLLTLAAYEAAGGVRGAIAASAEEAYGQLTAPQAAAARRLLLRMVESLLTLGGDERSETGVPPAEGWGRLAAVNGSGVRVWDVRSGGQPADLHDTGVKYAAGCAAIDRPDGSTGLTADRVD